jgi:hypothetical protein
MFAGPQLVQYHIFICVWDVYAGLLRVCEQPADEYCAVTTSNIIIVDEICSFHGSDCEAQNLLGCIAVFLFECRPTFHASIRALMMEAARTSETSVYIQLRTLQYIPEDSELHSCCCSKARSSCPPFASIQFTQTLNNQHILVLSATQTFVFRIMHCVKTTAHFSVADSSSFRLVEYISLGETVSRNGRTQPEIKMSVWI